MYAGKKYITIFLIAIKFSCTVHLSIFNFKILKIHLKDKYSKATIIFKRLVKTNVKIKNNQIYFEMQDNYISGEKLPWINL